MSRMIRESLPFVRMYFGLVGLVGLIGVLEVNKAELSKLEQATNQSRYISSEKLYR